MTTTMTSETKTHLKLLSLFHYIVGGLMIFFYSFPIIHIFIGSMIVSGTMSAGASDGPPDQIGWLFIAVGVAIVAFGWTLGATVIYAGRCLRSRKRWLFCLVVACLSMFFMPMGTVLGIFTVIVLVKEEVKEAFMRRELLGG